MASPFDITTPSIVIPLTDRQAVATFTVRSVVRRKLNATAKFITDPPASPSAKWLSFVLPDGKTSPTDVSRLFDLEDTKQYQIKIVVPPDAKAGGYNFKLVVAEDTNPDDNFTESASVTFTVPEPGERKLPIALIIGIIVVVLIVIGIIAFFVVRGGGGATPTATPTATATATPTATPTPIPLSSLGTQFRLVDNSVDYYFQLAQPGTIRVLPSWVGFNVDLVISIRDPSNQSGRSVQSDVSGTSLEYTVSTAEWQANKVWHVTLVNNTLTRATGAVDITYPSGAGGGQPFRDQFVLVQSSAETNIVVALSQPGTITGQVNWSGAANAIEARIRLPLQGDASLASRRDPSPMTVTYDVPDLSVGRLWVVSLIRQTTGTIAGTVTVRFP